MFEIYETFRNIVISDLVVKRDSGIEQTSNTEGFIASYNPADNDGVTIADIINYIAVGERPIFSHAISFDHHLMIKFLLEKGCNVHQPIHLDGAGEQKPILYTIDYVMPEIAKILLEGSGSSAKANINERYDDGSSLLSKCLPDRDYPEFSKYSTLSTAIFLAEHGIQLTQDDIDTINYFKSQGHDGIDDLIDAVEEHGKDENGDPITFTSSSSAIGTVEHDSYTTEISGEVSE